MKKPIAILICLLLLVGILAACNININLTAPTEESVAESTGEAVTEAPATEAVTEAATEAPTEPVIGALSDYVRSAVEEKKSFADGNTNTMRLPEILLDSADAEAVNQSIMDDYLDYTGNGDNGGAYALDYEAFLTGKILSVVITVHFEGGNSAGSAYNFDVTTGSSLDNAALCEALGKDHDTVISDLGSALKAYYDDKYAEMPGNDSERDKTLADDNVKAATLFVGGGEALTGLCDIYAAVGGGHWVAEITI